MHKPELIKLIDENKDLFWSVRRADLSNLSLGVVVEHFLNYGDIVAIRQLFNLIGIQKAAGLFNRQIKKSRINYHKRTVNFFTLYFQRHASGNIIT